MEKFVNTTKLSIPVFALLFSMVASAANIAGVKLEDTIQRDSQTLTLNGAGVREKFIFDIYVMGLYLPAKQTDEKILIAEPPSNRVLMHFVYKKVEREKLDSTWQESYEKNVSADQMKKLAERLIAFKSLFTDMVEGDVIWLDYYPEKGTEILINGVKRGQVDGADFNAAILSIWIGADPVDRDLKDNLLGR